jgi:hypothetical protein
MHPSNFEPPGVADGQFTGLDVTRRPSQTDEPKGTSQVNIDVWMLAIHRMAGAAARDIAINIRARSGKCDLIDRAAQTLGTNRSEFMRFVPAAALARGAESPLTRAAGGTVGSALEFPTKGV